MFAATQADVAMTQKEGNVSQRPKLMLPAQAFQAAAVPSAMPANFMRMSPNAGPNTPITTPMNALSTAWRLEACPGAPMRASAQDLSVTSQTPGVTPASSPLAGGYPVPPCTLWPRSVGGTPLANDGTPMSGVMFTHTASQQLRRGRSGSWSGASPMNNALNTGFIGTPLGTDSISPSSPFATDLTPIARCNSLTSVSTDPFRGRHLSVIDEAQARYGNSPDDARMSDMTSDADPTPKEQDGTVSAPPVLGPFSDDIPGWVFRVAQGGA